MEKEKIIHIKSIVVFLRWGKNLGFTILHRDGLGKDSPFTLLLHLSIGFYNPPKFAYEWVFGASLGLYPFHKNPELSTKFWAFSFKVPEFFYKKQKLAWEERTGRPTLGSNIK